MTSTAEQTAATLKGKGVMTGLEAEVTVSRIADGVIFVANGTEIPADPQYVVDKSRGVTLGRDGKTLSIVEHFLAACAMLNTTGYRVEVTGAPELPILDGGSQQWIDFLKAHFNLPDGLPTPKRVLTTPVYWQDEADPDHFLAAFPSKELQLTTLVDFPHREMTRRWLRWSPADGLLADNVAPARTFGMLSDLPKLQAKGFAQGVDIDNTLGLTDDGGFTAPMRLDDEPMRHKFLDLIGDLMLCGVPILEVQAHIIASKAGHGSHIPFGILLAQELPG